MVFFQSFSLPTFEKISPGPNQNMGEFEATKRRREEMKRQDVILPICQFFPQLDKFA